MLDVADAESIPANTVKASEMIFPNLQLTVMSS
jgi:hypothetical protein